MPKFDITDAKFEFEFPEDLDALKDKEGKISSWQIGRLSKLTFCHKNSDPNICPCYATRVKIDVNVYNTTTRYSKNL